MLRKTIYVLLIGAIVLNIGAGIVYNGIPDELRRILGGVQDENVDSASVVVPSSRSGDIYVTSYEMNLSVGRTDKESGAVAGSLSESGTITRTLTLEETSWELKGVQEMIYESNETGTLELNGDITRTRRIYQDEMTREMRENMNTILETRGFIGPNPQRSEVDVSLRDVRGSWEDLVWRSLLPANRTLREGSGGEFTERLSLDQLGVLLPLTSLKWSVDRISSDVEGNKALVIAEGPGTDGISITYRVLFSEVSPYPDTIELVARGSYSSDEGVTSVYLSISEVTRYFYTGSGPEISWALDPREAPRVEEVATPMDGMVIGEGGRETSFWATPKECLELALSEGRIVPEFVERYGEDRITTHSSSYSRNDTGISGSRVWNITLSGPESMGSSEAVSFEVITQPGGTSLVDRKRMGLLAESDDIVITTAEPGRNMLTLAGFESLLASSENADRFFISKQFSPNMVLDMVHRGNGGSSPFSTLLYNMVGMEREHRKDLFITYVPDASDPKKEYITVIDGSTGEIVSETVASGFCTLLFRSYGLDHA